MDMLTNRWLSAEGSPCTAAPLGSVGGARLALAGSSLISPLQDPAALGNALGGANVGAGPAGTRRRGRRRRGLWSERGEFGCKRRVHAGSSHPVGGARGRGDPAEPRERPHGERGQWMGRGAGTRRISLRQMQCGPRTSGSGSERGGPGRLGTRCRASLGRLDLPAPPTAVPAPEGLTARSRAPQCVGTWEGPWRAAALPGRFAPLRAEGGCVAGSRSCCTNPPGLRRTRLPSRARQVFRVEVLYHGRRHTVQRRYSEFHALHKRVRLRPPPTDRPRPGSFPSPERQADELAGPSLCHPHYRALESSGRGHRPPCGLRNARKGLGPTCCPCPCAAGLASGVLGADGVVGGASRPCPNHCSPRGRVSGYSLKFGGVGGREDWGGLLARMK